ncbi:MAG: hypothetical protein AB8H03_22225 [Saprospiraceae bacterium]
MKISSNLTLTEKQAYEAMLVMLKKYWKLTDSNDLTDILSGAEYIEEDVPADSAFWEYWQEAVTEVMNGKGVSIKNIK